MAQRRFEIANTQTNDTCLDSASLYAQWLVAQILTALLAFFTDDYFTNSFRGMAVNGSCPVAVTAKDWVIVIPTSCSHSPDIM